MKINPAGKEEIISVILTEENYPVAYAEKLKELKSSGVTEEEARICTITPPEGATAEAIAEANGEDPAYMRKMLERTSYLGYTSFYTGEDGQRIY